MAEEWSGREKREVIAGVLPCPALLRQYLVLVHSIILYRVWLTTLAHVPTRLFCAGQPASRRKQTRLAGQALVGIRAKCTNVPIPVLVLCTRTYVSTDAAWHLGA